jgi:tetratricopeptide (TPR) repeat protein
VRGAAASAGGDDPAAWYFRAQQARVAEATGQRREAMRIWTQAIDRMAASAPRDGTYTLADTHLWLGRALVAEGQPAAAESHLRYAVDFRRRTQPAAHPQRAVAECDLARAYAALGQTAAARELLSACVPRIERYALLEPPLREAAVALQQRLQAMSTSSRQ